jgi:hypothetical protein
MQLRPSLVSLTGWPIHPRSVRADSTSLAAGSQTRRAGDSPDPFPCTHQRLTPAGPGARAGFSRRRSTPMRLRRSCASASTPHGISLSRDQRPQKPFQHPLHAARSSRSAVSDPGERPVQAHLLRLLNHVQHGAGCDASGSTTNEMTANLVESADAKSFNIMFLFNFFSRIGDKNNGNPNKGAGLGSDVPDHDGRDLTWTRSSPVPTAANPWSGGPGRPGVLSAASAAA